MNLFDKKKQEAKAKNVMYLYMIVDCVAQKSSSIFEASNPAVMVRNLKHQKEFMANVEEYDIHQVGYIDNYGEMDYRVELDMATWRATTFIEKFEYKEPDLKAGGQ